MLQINPWKCTDASAKTIKTTFFSYGEEKNTRVLKKRCTITKTIHLTVCLGRRTPEQLPVHRTQNYYCVWTHNRTQTHFGGNFRSQECLIFKEVVEDFLQQNICKSWLWVIAATYRSIMVKELDHEDTLSSNNWKEWHRRTSLSLVVHDLMWISESLQCDWHDPFVINVS